MECANFRVGSNNTCLLVRILFVFFLLCVCCSYIILLKVVYKIRNLNSQLLYEQLLWCKKNNMVATNLVATENNVSLLDSLIVFALAIHDFQGTLICSLFHTIDTLVLVDGSIFFVLCFFSIHIHRSLLFLLCSLVRCCF